MIKWTKEVRASQKLNPREAFEVDNAVYLIKSALTSGIKQFIGSDKGVRIQYANGLNGTLWECDVNRRLPFFKVFTEEETRARIVCTVTYPRNGETLLVTLEYRKEDSQEWNKVESSITFYECDWNNLKMAFDAAFDNDYDYDIYWGIGNEIHGHSGLFDGRE